MVDELSIDKTLHITFQLSALPFHLVKIKSIMLLTWTNDDKTS